MIHGYFFFISVSESSLKPSSDAESALAMHVTDGGLGVTYWFPTTLRSFLIMCHYVVIVFLSILKIMSHTKLCNSDKVFWKCFIMTIATTPVKLFWRYFCNIVTICSAIASFILKFSLYKDYKFWSLLDPWRHELHNRVYMYFENVKVVDPHLSGL